MAETLTDRFGRLGAGSARFAVAGGAALVVLAVAALLVVVGVDTVETVATLLVVPVFAVALYSGRGPGFACAALATGAYVVLRRPDLGDTGSVSFALLIVTRAVAYGIVAHAGAWARTLVSGAVAGADDWADSPLVLREERRARGEPGEVEPWTSPTPMTVPAGAPVGPAPAGPPPVPEDEPVPPGPPPTLFEGAPDDGWVDEPHPSDWRVGASALPPDDPQAGPWTGPTELVPGGPAGPADGDWAGGAGPGPGAGPGDPGDRWTGPQPAVGWGEEPAGPEGPPPGGGWAGEQAPAAADRWGDGPVSGQHPALGAGALGAGSLGSPWSGQQPAVRPNGPDDRWSGRQPAVPPGGAPGGWPGDEPGDGRVGPGDRWSGQQPAARGGAPDGSWSGQQPSVGPGGPGDRWSGQQPAARGGPDGSWSGQQPSVEPWDDGDDGPVSGRQPAADRWQGPASGRWPAVSGEPAGPPQGPAPSPGVPTGEWAPDDVGAPAWGGGPGGQGGPVRPGSPQEWEEAEAELAARLEQQGHHHPPDPWEQVQPDRMWRRRTGSTRAVGAEPPPPQGGPPVPVPVPVPVEQTLPPVDPETRLWSARYLCDRLATEQREAKQAGRPFSLVLVQVPDGPLAALSYRRQVTLLRELGHQFVAGGMIDHLVHVPDQVQHWFAVILPDTDRPSAKAFERRLRNGIGGYLRSRGLLLGELQSACLTSPDDDQALGVIWDTLIARGQPSPPAAAAPPR